MFMLLLTFSQFTPLHLCHPPSFSPLSFLFIPFALSYIVLAISRSMIGPYSSISAGDPSPLGKRGWKRSEYRNAFYLLSLFYSVSLMFPFPCSLFLYLPSLSHSLSMCQEISLKAGCMQKSPELHHFAYSGLC